MLRSAVAHDDR
jgi:transposase